MRLLNKSVFYIVIILIPIVIFFSPVLANITMPIPADTIVGLYHPFRDVVWKGFEAGVPFKNFLITDAVRQQYPWRKLTFDLLKKGQLPGWNPYTHLGTPLAANVQTAIFYPLNGLFFLLPFNAAWTSQVILQQVLLAIFSFLYLKEIGRTNKAATLASLALTFSGFSIAWLEWNTTLHTLTWLPLALLSIEKLLKKVKLIWLFSLAFSLVSISLAGFLQTAFYSHTMILFYFIFKLLSGKKIHKKNISGVVISFVIAFTISALLLLPSIKLISSSARDIDQGEILAREDWFLPLQNLVQFIAPDFFGNPTTLNYWGVFNYTEFIGYIGIIPITFFLVGTLSKPKSEKDVKNRNFFLSILLIALIFATPNFISKLPFRFKFPFLSTAQPSRIIMIMVFSTVTVSSYGLDIFFKFLSRNNDKNKIQSLKPIIVSLITVIAILLCLWIVAIQGQNYLSTVTTAHLHVTRRNLILPTFLILISTTTLIFSIWMRKKTEKTNNLKTSIAGIFIVLYLITTVDLLRFGWKFTPFTDPDFLYPQTETIKFLKSDKSTWRYMTTDRRILPPNFSVIYKLQTIEGYDPIYLKRYGQLIASAQKGKPTLEPTPFHRIIRPDNYESTIYDILNVKYILSLSEISHPKLVKVFQEGETRVYENQNTFPRVFVLTDYFQPNSDFEALEQLFALNEERTEFSAQIVNYNENFISIQVETNKGGMLVLSDNYYPGWRASLDGKPTEIQRVLYSLRGTIVPPGKHEVLYSYSQL